MVHKACTNPRSDFAMVCATFLYVLTELAGCTKPLTQFCTKLHKVHRPLSGNLHRPAHTPDPRYYVPTGAPAGAAPAGRTRAVVGVGVEA